MKRKKKIIIIGSVLVGFILLGLFGYFVFIKNSASVITTNDIDSSVNTDDGDEKIVWSNYETREIELSDSIKITEEGVYNLSGTISDGCITVLVDGNVKLNLNGVSIKNSNGPAIYVANASDVVIELDGDNYLEDGSSYSGYDEDVDSVLFSHDDLTIQGSGTLNIKANYQDGIVSKDDLKIVSGTYVIDSADDGIRGKDSVYILDGNFEITATGDGIKSTNDTDSDRGFIKISNGIFDINASLDGIQAETKLVIEDGEFNIVTGGGSSNASSSSSSWGSWGGAKIQNSTSSVDSTDSAKGIKAGDNIVISGGTFIFDTSDDSIHSNNYVGISKGTFNISSGDDGIHADLEIVIDGGVIKINKSYEGIEAASITINDGDINLVSTDDGINVAGGNDSSATNRPGENNYANSNNILTVNGGTIYVDATGDGIDVNGSAYIMGGNITVDGPVDGGNAALDYDGSFEISGGTFIAVGSSGMAQGATSGSSQYNVTVYFSSTYSSEDVITIVDSSNNEVMSYSPSKKYSSLVFSSSKLKENTTYTIKVNNSTISTFTTNTKCITVGNSGIGNGMNGGNMKGRR